ncbi:hypothetical protein C922_03601 [Plasmodium inui San Antonio 1]|uniref:Uncharacterized protein n=1 Tax=Plasmodium inui San Antonio 1 TaxID=1237626 RepID=W6ZYE6_9APIC|nr:hypothetical protein C922_03601 [Plasmodium inui San Antonio 1]EUD65877.1 hypothetical protein C922_03601 [Plasmodium inui San Antonio 1]
MSLGKSGVGLLEITDPLSRGCIGSHLLRGLMGEEGRGLQDRQQAGMYKRNENPQWNNSIDATEAVQITSPSPGMNAPVSEIRNNTATHSEPQLIRMV